ncbi:MAG TPA: cytochrome c family protein [Alphaproteobacteria bacterium]|nr:cytochrome c family protein [Alphaproteobacteria bacterium]
MSGYELNKIAGAVLGSLLLLMAINEIGNFLVHPSYPEKPAIAVAVPEGGEAGGKAKEEEPKQVPLPQLLAQADASKGERIAAKCKTCHSLDKGGANKVGPHLYGVLGRDKASVSDFSYSAALKGLGGKWTYEDLFHFIKDPQSYAQGTKMSFPGLKKPGDRADLLLYLRQQNDNPPPLPEVKQAAKQPAAEEGGKAEEGKAPAGEQKQASAGGDQESVTQMVAQADPDKGKRIAAKCKVCHSLDKGGANKIGPHLYGVLGRDKASVSDFSYSDALKGLGGKWTYDDLFHFVEDPQAYAKGTKMTFPGIKKADDRADLLAYLREQNDNPPPLK